MGKPKPMDIRTLIQACENRKIKRVSAYGVVRGIVPNKNRGKLLHDTDEIQWVNVELVGVRLPYSSMERCLLPAQLGLLDKIEEYHRVSGEVQVLATLAELHCEPSSNGLTLTSPLIVFDVPNWGLQYRKENSYELLGWVSVGNTFKMIPCAARVLQSSTFDEDKQAYELFKGYFVDDVVQRIRTSDVTKLPCGVEYSDVGMPVSTRSVSLGQGELPQSVLGTGVAEQAAELGFERVTGEVSKTQATLVAGVQERDSFSFLPEDKLDELVSIFDKAVAKSTAKIKGLQENAERSKKVLPKTTYAGIARRLKNNWGNTLQGGGLSGRVLFKDALERVLPKAKADKVLDAWLGAYGVRLLDIWTGAETVIDDTSDKQTELLGMLYTSRYEIYLALLGVCLRLSCNLVDVYKAVQRVVVKGNAEAFMQSFLCSNPYDLCLIQKSVSISDMDKLAMFMGKFGAKELQKARNVAYLHTFFGDDKQGSTVWDKRSLPQMRATVVHIGKAELTALKQTGYILPSKQLSMLVAYISPDVPLEQFQLPQDGWRELHIGAERSMKDNVDSAQMLGDYLETGLGLQYRAGGKEYVADTALFGESLYLYRRLCKQWAECTILGAEDDVDGYCKAFEQAKAEELGVQDFKLEAKQRRALSLLGRNGVLAVTGPAGSGKTTVAEALVYMLEQGYGVTPGEILFVAPTGRAANRLRDVVKRPAATIHRAFDIGVKTKEDEESVLLSSDAKKARKGNRRKATDGVKVLIVDECSMITLGLFYEMLTKVPSDTRIIFLGDIEQLPPIGVGKPFSDILRFVPTVCLDVSKRAEEGSAVTSNSKRLLQGVTDFAADKDFAVVQKNSEDEVAQYIQNLCLYYKGMGSDIADVFGQGLGLTDVQIISPLKKRASKWGTEYLNNLLHDVFNPYETGYRVFVGGAENQRRDVEFRIGDRVIHLSNDYHMVHFALKEGKYVLLSDEGVMNGDVGKIVDILHSYDFEYEGAFAEDCEPPMGAAWYYIVCAYEDVSAGVYYALYPFEMSRALGNDIYAGAGSLDTLDLAFALTVHKMQGSQVRTAVIPWVRFIGGGFMNKNMLYTAITRAEKSVVLVGNVEGSRSAVSLASKCGALRARTTLYDTVQGYFA